MSYADTVRQHLRITILRCLAEENDYKLNESLLASLLSDFGFTRSHAEIRTEIAWLAEQGLVAVEDVRGLQIAGLTERGGDVAASRAIVPGVKRPGPND